MPLVTETADDYARAEYMAAKKGLVRAAGVALGDVVHAQVNAGRWLAQCPACAAARLVAPGRDFWCAGCGNTATAGQPVRVVWPDELDTIEQVLSWRPVRNRNWRQGETIEHLIGENVLHDLPGLWPAGDERERD